MQEHHQPVSHLYSSQIHRADQRIVQLKMAIDRTRLRKDHQELHQDTRHLRNGEGGNKVFNNLGRWSRILPIVVTSPSKTGGAVIYNCQHLCQSQLKVDWHSKVLTCPMLGNCPFASSHTCTQCPVDNHRTCCACISSQCAAPHGTSPPSPSEQRTARLQRICGLLSQAHCP